MSSSKTEDLRIVNKLGQRYLFNRANEVLKRVRVVDELWSVELEIVYPSPVYEMLDIPPHSYVELTDEDLNLDGAQSWRIELAEWEGETVLDEPFIMTEVKRWGGAEFSETQVDRELRHIGSVPGYRVGEDLTSDVELGELYVQKIGIFQDVQRTLHFLNRSYVEIEMARLACYHFRRENGRWPDSKHDAERKEITVRDVPPRSYLPILSDFDTNHERFEFDLLESKFSDGERFLADAGTDAAAWDLPITNQARSTPLEKRNLTRAEGTVEGLDRDR